MVRCSDGSLYCGISPDVEGRLREHNAGTGARYTRQRRPVVLVYSEELPSRVLAMKREAEVKRWARTKKGDLVRAANRNVPHG
jgi:putative endonuclease